MDCDGTTRRSTGEIGSSTYPFGKIYLGNSTTGGSLTIESGKLVLNGTALTLGDTDTLKSGTNKQPKTAGRAAGRASG